jgi:hypothetical protein
MPFEYSFFFFFNIYRFSYFFFFKKKKFFCYLFSKDIIFSTVIFFNYCFFSLVKSEKCVFFVEDKEVNEKRKEEKSHGPFMFTILKNVI